MRTFLTIATVLPLLTTPNPLHAQAGAPDLDFAGDGIQAIDLSEATRYDMIADAVPLPDGRILTVGAAEPIDEFRDLCVATFLPDGTLQHRALFDFSPGIFNITGMAAARAMVDGEERYYVLCKREISGYQQLNVVRLDADLALDPLWDGDGSAVIYFNADEMSLPCEPRDIAVQPDGKVVVAGSFNGVIALARFTAAGELDNSFSFDGKVITDLPDYTEEIANALAITPTGDILIAGNITTDGTPTSAGFVARYSPDGSFDASFGDNGMRFITYGSGVEALGNARVNAMLVQVDGRIVLAGSSTTTDGSDTDFGIARLMPDGAFDNEFSSDGKVRVNFPADETFNADHARAIAIDATGKLTIAGNMTTGIGELGLVRLHIDGSLDQGFGSNGMVVTDQGTAACTVKALFIDVQQRIVVGGGLRMPSTDPQYDSFLQRFLGLTEGLPELTAAAADVTVFPNPMAGQVTLRYSLGEAAHMCITLHDTQGREVYQVMRGRRIPAGTHQQLMDIPASLAPGNYLLLLSTAQGKTAVRVTI